MNMSSDRPLGTRRNRGKALMAIGIVLLLLFTVLSLGEITNKVARVNTIVLIAGLVSLAFGAFFYAIARNPRD